MRAAQPGTGMLQGTSHPSLQCWDVSGNRPSHLSIPKHWDAAGNRPSIHPIHPSPQRRGLRIPHGHSTVPGAVRDPCPAPAGLSCLPALWDVEQTCQWSCLTPTCKSHF